MSDANLTGLSLLIVEDEALLRKRLAAQLEQLGADVTGAETLKEARRWLGDLGFDLVLQGDHVRYPSLLSILEPPWRLRKPGSVS